MAKKKLINRLNVKLKDNHGTTFVEMIVCFALLAIFMVCAATIISSITMMYYNIKGEIYSRQVSDIVLEKISSEIDGAQYSDNNISEAPDIENHNKITLYDKTDTKVSLYNGSGEDSDKGLIIDYHEIKYVENGVENPNLSRDNSKWFFEKSLYNGFELKDLKFYSGGDSISSEDSSKYGVSDISGYKENVILVLIELEHDKYGKYTFHRFIKMYNVPDVLPTPTPAPGG